MILENSLPSPLGFLSSVFKVDECSKSMKLKSWAQKKHLGSHVVCFSYWSLSWDEWLSGFILRLSPQLFTVTSKRIRAGYFHFEAMALSASHLTGTFSFPILPFKGSFMLLQSKMKRLELFSPCCTGAAVWHHGCRVLVLPSKHIGRHILSKVLRGFAFKLGMCFIETS